MFDLDNGTLSFKTPPDFEAPRDTGTNNFYDLTIRVTERTAQAFYQEVRVRVQVRNINEEPIITSQIPQQQIRVNSAARRIGLNDKFEDPDGDVLHYETSTSDEAVATASIDQGSVMLTPMSEGTTTVTVTAHDRLLESSERYSVSQSFGV